MEYSQIYIILIKISVASPAKAVENTPPFVDPLAVSAKVPPRVKPSGATDKLRQVLQTIPNADRWQIPLAGPPDKLWLYQDQPISPDPPLKKPKRGGGE